MAAAGADQVYVRFRSKNNADEWFVHPDLRARLVAEADEKGTNLTDLAVQILCQHFNVPYNARLRQSSPGDDKGYLLFNMPHELRRVIAATYPNKWQDGVRFALCSYFGLEVPPKIRRTRSAGVTV